MQYKSTILEQTYSCGCGIGTITFYTRRWPGNTSGPPERCYESHEEDAGVDECEVCGNDNPDLVAPPASCPIRHWDETARRFLPCGKPTVDESWFCQHHLETL